ncbi:MAG: alpha/beta hydrolase [Burkholderiales bacterium]|nr:alpha/beta hydrolase [Burkholderiales bacterium]
MTDPRRKFVQCVSPAGLHRIAYSEWGDPANPRVLLCVHGLARRGSDFDPLARALCGEMRVICPDMAGRGDSDRLADARLYQIPQYVSDVVTLIARLDVPRLRWFGTSMGGLIGMALAAQAGSPIERMVLNDVGPVVKAAALQRIGEYLGNAPTFAAMEEAVAYIRTVSATFGLESDAEWQHLAHTSVQAVAGGWRLHYDPAIAVPFREAGAGNADIELWPLYDAITCPVVLVRGAASDLLDRATAQAMTARGPRARLIEIPGVGHAPMFWSQPQIALVRDFLVSP